MIKIPAKIRYAVRTLAVLGKKRPAVVPLTAIEASQDISAKFAKQIMQPLEKARLVGSRRGIYGGYLLRIDPDSITLQMVFEAFRPGEKMVPCLGEESVCDRTPDCGARPVWQNLQQTMDGFLAQTTIQDVIDGEDWGPSPS